MAITTKKESITLSALDTSFTDVFQPDSGEIWTILRFTYRVTAQVGGGALEIERTDSGDTQIELILDRDPVAVDSESVVMNQFAISPDRNDMRSIVIDLEGKIRARRVGGTSMDVDFTISVVEET